MSLALYPSRVRSNELLDRLRNARLGRLCEVRKDLSVERVGYARCLHLKFSLIQGDSVEDHNPTVRGDVQAVRSAERKVKCVPSTGLQSGDTSASHA